MYSASLPPFGGKRQIMKNKVNQKTSNNTENLENYLTINGKEIPCSKEVYHAVKDPARAEKKQKQRDWRCRNGNGVRCTKDCTQCDYYRFIGDPTGNTVSLDQMYDESEFEPGAPGSTEDTVIYTVLFEELLKILGEIKPKYAQIFELLYDGYNHYEIAKTLDIPRSTVTDDIKKLRKVAQEYSKDLC
jgi:RNA polymerase sigma factor (sigma-70 family)